MSGTEAGGRVSGSRFALGAVASRFGARIRRASVRDLLLWYGIASLVVYAVPTTWRLRQTPWNLPADQEVQAWYWMVAFVASAFGVVLQRARERDSSPAWQAGFLLGPWVVALVTLFARTDLPHSRLIGLASFALGAILATFPALLPARLNRATAVMAVSSALLGGELNRRSNVRAEPAVFGTETLMTSLLPLALTTEYALIPDTTIRGGAIVAENDGFLLATAQGTWFFLSWDTTQSRLGARRLSLSSPLVRTGVIRESAAVRKPLIRVTGLAIDTTHGEGTAYLAHEIWRRDERCIAIQVSALPLRDVMKENPEANWRPIYVTSPCIRPGLGFDPYESGGRLLLLPDGSLLLSVGDYGRNRVLEQPDAQLEASDYGKTIRISREGVRSLYTMGHRNSQGLAVDLEGNVWASEHGPQGGDEINLLKSGANYGWPFVTHGTEYGSYRWRDAPVPRTHGAFTEPVIAFVPSVALSSLLTVRSPLIPQWSGDVLAGTLKGEQLLRLRVAAGRVLYVESIRVGRRIRDLAEGTDGRIVLMTDGGDVLWLSPATAVMDGSRLFEACQRCHNAKARGVDIGPELAGLFDRPIASRERFEYSDALRKLGGYWTDERLDAFLKSPATYAPGTTMQFAGMTDRTERRVLRDYLRFVARGSGF